MKDGETTTAPDDASSLSRQRFIDAYTTRLGMPAPEAISLQALSALQRRHMMTIPFENIDVLLNRGAALSLESLVQKILLAGRGGYCFELNSLYAHLLRAIGFAVSPHLGRVWLRDPVETPPRNHLTHLVEIDGKRFLTDVGFGARASRIPLDIDAEEPCDDGDGLIRVVPWESGERMLQRHDDGDWRNQYSFELNPATKSDVEVANHYMATHSDSHFRHDLFLGLFTEEGRIGLWNAKLTERHQGRLDQRELETVEEWFECTKRLFAIDLSLGDEERGKVENLVSGSPPA